MPPAEIDVNGLVENAARENEPTARVNRYTSDGSKYGSKSVTT